MRYEYPALFEKSGRVVRITFRELPEAGGFTVTSDDVPAVARDMLNRAVKARLQRNDPIPAPTARKAHETFVPLDVDIALKAALVIAMRKADTSHAELAQALQVDEKVIRRMLDPGHATRIDKLSAGLKAIGVVPVVDDGAPVRRGRAGRRAVK